MNPQKSIPAIFMTVLIFLLCTVCAVLWKTEVIPVAAVKKVPDYCIVIDAGHGGIDGGAVGGSGVLEKTLNLSVAKKIAVLCEISGIPYRMTRDTDCMLGERKMQDLTERVRIAKETENAVFVSIHMNHYPDKRCQGLQVWYSPNSKEASAGLAAWVQTYARTYLYPDNARQVKAANSSIYVLYHAPCPAVLIECGFLSNPSECEKLTTDTYQCELAMTIFSGILAYLSER